jgi:hypothetical protein
MIKKFFSFFAFVLLFHSATALSCNGLSGGDLYVCNSISQTTLSQNEKDLLIADILNKNKTTPNFDFVYSWNNNLKIESPSNNKYSSSGTINSAWIEIIALMPSILEDGILLTTNQGSLKTEYDYSYRLPSGTLSGDCKTTYSLRSNIATLNVFLNNHYIGNSKSSQFNIQNTNPNLTFRSELTIQLSYDVARYKRRYYKRYSRCEYRRTETRTDTLKISDSLNAQLYQIEPLSEFEITSIYNNITRGTLQANNFTNLILSFNNSQYRNSKYIYSLNYSLPHYVLTLKAEKVDQTDFSNIFVEKQGNNYSFNVRDSSSCKIKLFTHFSSINRNCNMNFNEIAISIKADKVNYYENSTIRVRITPENYPINITYANQTKIVEGYAEFNATLRANKIFTEVNGKEIAYFVNVIEREKISFLMDISSLSLVGFIFFRFIRAYLGITI